VDRCQKVPRPLRKPIHRSLEMAERIAKATARYIESVHYGETHTPDPEEEVLQQQARQEMRALHQVARRYLPEPDPTQLVSSQDIEQALRRRS
jgi:hypothetical protein